FFLCLSAAPPWSPLFPYTTLFRSVGRAPQPALPGAPAADDEVDGEPAAAPVRPARRPGGPARAGRPGPDVGPGLHRGLRGPRTGDRKSTRLNSSHQIISYAVFCSN